MISGTSTQTRLMRPPRKIRGTVRNFLPIGLAVPRTGLPPASASPSSGCSNCMPATASRQSSSRFTSESAAAQRPARSRSSPAWPRSAVGEAMARSTAVARCVDRFTRRASSAACRYIRSGAEIPRSVRPLRSTISLARARTSRAVCRGSCAVRMRSEGSRVPAWYQLLSWLASPSR